MLHFDQEEGFTIINNVLRPEWGKSLRLKTDIRASLAFLYKKNIKNIEINECEGASITDLEFLRNNSYVEGIDIVTPLLTDIDVSAINTCKNLKRVSIGFAHQQEVDLSNFPDLTDATLYWSKNLRSLESCRKLRSVSIENFSGSNLVMLKQCQDLKRLYLRNTSIKNFEGIEAMEYLIDITLISGRHLETLKGISDQHIRLNTLKIYSAKKLTDILPLKNASNLELVDLWKIGLVTEEEAELWSNLPSVKRFRIVNKKGIILKKF